MIQLTQKGKEIYGDTVIVIRKIRKQDEDYTVYSLCEHAHDGTINRDGTPRLKVIGYHVIASNPLELKALLDMGLIEIKISYPQNTVATL